MTVALVAVQRDGSPMLEEGSCDTVGKSHLSGVKLHAPSLSVSSSIGSL